MLKLYFPIDKIYERVDRTHLWIVRSCWTFFWRFSSTFRTIMASKTRNGCRAVSLCTLTVEAFWANQACSKTGNIAEEGNQRQKRNQRILLNSVLVLVILSRCSQVKICLRRLGEDKHPSWVTWNCHFHHFQFKSTIN